MPEPRDKFGGNINETEREHRFVSKILKQCGLDWIFGEREISEIPDQIAGFFPRWEQDPEHKNEKVKKYDCVFLRLTRLQGFNQPVWSYIYDRTIGNLSGLEIDKVRIETIKQRILELRKKSSNETTG